MNAVELLKSLMKDLLNLVKGKKGVNVEALVNPEKYAVCLSIDKVVADSKVSTDGIERYKQKIANKEKIKPVLVVKHPSKERYAVLDGHHLYYAAKSLDKKEIEVAVIGDYSQVMYYLTKNGYFQPSSEIRTPILELHKNIKEFLEDFARQ